MSFPLIRFLYRSFLVTAISANAKEVTVTNRNSAGPGSLREALGLAEEGDIIVFIPSLNGKTILLEGTQLLASQRGVIVDASSLPGGLTLDARRRSRVLKNTASGALLGGVNVSANQSSTDGDLEASFAVNGDLSDYTSTLPTDPNPSLTVDLNERRIGKVKIHNRGDGFDQDRLRDITVTLLDDNDIVLWKSPLLNPGNRLGFRPDNGGVPSAPLVVVFPPMSVSKVKISKQIGGEGEADVLAIGEVEIFLTGTTLKNLTLTGGRGDFESDSKNGGGIFNSKGADLALLNCSVIGNHAADGNGGEFIAGGEGLSGTITNAAPGGMGGGIYNAGTLSIHESTVARNSAGKGGDGEVDGFNFGGFGGDGGAIYNDFEAVLAVSTSTIANNRAGDGGDGESGDEDDGGYAGASGAGGGISNKGDLFIIASTITQNSAGQDGAPASGGSDGGGISNNGSTYLSNSIVADNVFFGRTGRDIHESGILMASERNLLSDVGGTGLTAGDNGIIEAPANLQPLGHYGGPTLTALPKENSAAIGNASGPNRIRDQRGDTIILLGGENPELGSVEYQGEATEFHLAFNLDSDGDGNANGIEAALGTDAYHPDAGNPRNLAIRKVNGSSVLSFGYARNDITLKLVRTQDFKNGVVLAESNIGGEDSFTVPVDPDGLVNIQDGENLGSAFYYLVAEE